jgi:hypothetical protein
MEGTGKQHTDKYTDLQTIAITMSAIPWRYVTSRFGFNLLEHFKRLIFVAQSLHIRPMLRKSVSVMNCTFSQFVIFYYVQVGELFQHVLPILPFNYFVNI